MWPQAMGSNNLSNSIICSSICPSGCPRAFCDFMSVYMVVRRPFWTRINASRRWTPTLEINTNTFPVWGSSIAIHFPPKWGPETPVGSIRDYTSLCLSILTSLCPSGRPRHFWTIIHADRSI